MRDLNGKKKRENEKKLETWLEKYEDAIPEMSMALRKQALKELMVISNGTIKNGQFGNRLTYFLSQNGLKSTVCLALLLRKKAPFVSGVPHIWSRL